MTADEDASSAELHRAEVGAVWVWPDTRIQVDLLTRTYRTNGATSAPVVETTAPPVVDLRRIRDGARAAKDPGGMTAARARELAALLVKAAELAETGGGASVRLEMGSG